MEVTINLNGTKYGVVVESGSYPVKKYTTIQDPNSKNYGKEHVVDLSYPSTFSRAVQRIIREEAVQNDQTVGLNEYAQFIKGLTDSVTEQLKGIDI